MEPMMDLIKTLNALNESIKKLTEKMSTECISTLTTRLRRSAQDLSLKKNQNLYKKKIRQKYRLKSLLTVWKSEQNLQNCHVLVFLMKSENCFRITVLKGSLRSKMQNFLH